MPNSNIFDYKLDKKTDHEMPDNTKIDLNVSA